jgi:exonuclease SbcD
MLTVLHTGDWHIGPNAETRKETVRCVSVLLDEAERNPPVVIIIAGDTLDELQGRIMLDSEAARAAIDLVERAANIAPVVMVRGTKSHDRESPGIFRHLRTRHPILVASEPKHVLLCRSAPDGAFFFTVADGKSHAEIVAAFTLLPSIDKAWVAATFPDGIREGNAHYRELLHDLLGGFGLMNEPLSCPRILVGHGMVTGACFSTGQEAIGEDLEFGVDTLRAARCDYVALGHVHKFQTFGKEIAYCGSPGRLNFGEKEEKGALLVDVERGQDPVLRFVPTPARRFVFAEVEWNGREDIDAEVARVESECSGAHVRVRYTIPEANRHEISRAEIEARLLAAGAVVVKVEAQIIPTTRQRAAGISKAASFPEKVLRWGDATGIDIPPRVMEIARVIEGLSVEELKGRFP